MKDNTKENTPDRNGGDQQDASGDAPLASSTPQQRRAIIKGLRILARVAIRSYLREHGANGQAETDTDEEEG